MYTTDFAYDGPIFLVSLSPSYPSSPVVIRYFSIVHKKSYKDRTRHLFCNMKCLISNDRTERATAGHVV